jgi:hypothetical protein
MDDRRTFLALAGALVPGSLITFAAQSPAPAGPREPARHGLTGPLEARGSRPASGCVHAQNQRGSQVEPRRTPRSVFAIWRLGVKSSCAIA